ncbi:hypothetical protein FRB90_009739 [Tulasnella sp. 427]|nr:hypothetical protein FRB90_009739 [Tulasnella sp. 427]
MGLTPGMMALTAMDASTDVGEALESVVPTPIRENGYLMDLPSDHQHRRSMFLYRDVQTARAVLVAASTLQDQYRIHITLDEHMSPSDRRAGEAMLVSLFQSRPSSPDPTVLTAAPEVTMSSSVLRADQDDDSEFEREEDASIDELAEDVLEDSVRGEDTSSTSSDDDALVRFERAIERSYLNLGAGDAQTERYRGTVDQRKEPEDEASKSLSDEYVTRQATVNGDEAVEETSYGMLLQADADMKTAMFLSSR